MPSPNSEQLEGRLRGVLEPLVERAGFELDAVEVRPAGRRSAVTVVVDRADGPSGIGLDDVATLSREAAGELDRHEELLDGAYTLEVTSPGVDRPLTRPRHWQRAWLRLARIRLADGTELDARIGRADETAVQVVDRSGRRPELRELAYADVAHAQVEVEFRSPPRAETELLDPGAQDDTDADGEEDHR